MTEIEKSVVSVIPVNRDGHVLLQQRDDRTDLLYAGSWTFFGGSVEAGETPNDAIHREVREELGAEFNVIFWMQYMCLARTIPGEITTTNYVYFAVVDPDLMPLTLLEGQAMQWMSKDEALTHDLAFRQTPVLQQFFDAGLESFGKDAS